MVAAQQMQIEEEKGSRPKSQSFPSQQLTPTELKLTHRRAVIVPPGLPCLLPDGWGLLKNVKSDPHSSLEKECNGQGDAITSTNLSSGTEWWRPVSFSAACRKGIPCGWLALALLQEVIQRPQASPLMAPPTWRRSGVQGKGAWRIGLGRALFSK